MHFDTTRPHTTGNAGFQPAARTSFAVILFLCALLAVGPAAAGSGCTETAPSTPQAAVPSNVTSPPAPSAGLRVHVDPQTGKLLDRPPEGETPEPLPEQPAAAEDDIPVVVRPDGTVVADIGDRYRTALHAEIVDGELVTCHRPVGETAGDRAVTAETNGD